MLGQKEKTINSLVAQMASSPDRDKHKWTIAFRPLANGMYGDRLFRAEKYVHTSDVSHWLEPARQLARTGARCGLEFHTDDMVNMEDADALILDEMPHSTREVMGLKERHRKLKVILQITETPLGRAWVFDPANHSAFDAVVTYNDRLAAKPGYFIYKLPTGGLTLWETLRPGHPAEQRKTACMVANAPNPAPWFPRRSGVGMARAGWRFTPYTWWNYVREGGSLYRERLAVASGLAGMLPGEFDIFGPGWDKLKDAGIQSAWHGPWHGSKLELLGRYRFNIAYENCFNDVGYISEKIFDAFLAGTVPVYLGNQRIREYVPAGSFIDARDFKTLQELGDSLNEMSREQWTEMRAAGDEFLRHGADVLFGAAQYAKAVIEAIRFALQGH